MGEVYRAEDTVLKRPVALKRMAPHLRDDPTSRQRFLHEAERASKLNDPHIAGIYDVLQESGEIFLVMEFIEGETLRQRLKQPSPLPEFLEFAVQSAGALTAAHTRGILHRDIKPENIMLRRDGYVKVLDFGLAKLIEPFRAGQDAISGCDTSDSGNVRTDPGKIMGTPRYMAPEQILGKKVDARADIFSLGVVLYEMVAGRAPFDGVTSGEVIAAILEREPPPLHRYAREVPDQLERIVYKGLAKDREDRYKVAKDLLIDLKDLKLDLELEAKLKRARQTTVQESAEEGQRLTQDTESSTITLQPAPACVSHEDLESEGGAVPLGSKFYIVRRADEELRAAIARRESIVLIKGARQVGKTSLLARGLEHARASGATVILTDLQKLNTSDLVSVEAFYKALAGMMAESLDLDVAHEAIWNPDRGPSLNFERYVRREALAKISPPTVWGLDEVDRLFTCSFGSEVFGLFRSWHNERSLNPSAPWQRLTMAITYATEAHLFISDMNQSPFNVGKRLALEDFSFDQVAELNSRHGSPLKDKAEIARFYRLVGGHPYLVRCGLREMVVHNRNLTSLESIASNDDGPFGDHLRRIVASLEQDAALCEIVRGILQGKPCPTQESFYRLRSAGLVAGGSTRDARPRCLLYANYLEQRLL
jgi:serine/threonine protein kinase